VYSGGERDVRLGGSEDVELIRVRPTILVTIRRTDAQIEYVGDRSALRHRGYVFRVGPAGSRSLPPVSFSGLDGVKASSAAIRFGLNIPGESEDQPRLLRWLVVRG